ncbi:hypothetical protein [Nocardioides alcanivorans]|uniref:hypothetical protein n=1 Tax=Nocardioides alcanivorans TaxID=2897352 RepID=UPI001F407A01|nr:hypothetical protein [Nocardioides alcanivorans]
MRPDGSVVVPDTLDAVLDARVRSLPERTQRVLEVAAVIGHRFDGRVLTGAVAQAPLEIDPHDVAEALKEAHVSGLVSMVADSRDFTFVHALVRDRLQQRMRSRDRTHAHALVARALSRFSIADPRHEDLLTHHIVAGWPVCTTGEVVERLYAAGAAATRQSAFAEAAQHLLRALDFLVMDPEFPPDVWLGRLLAAAGQAATAAEDLDAARRCMSALHQRGKEQDDPLTALRGALGVVRTYATERVDEPAVDRLAEALDVLLKGPAAGTAEERDLIAESLRALHIYRAAQARTLRTQVVERDPDARTAVLTLLWEQENVPNRLELAAEVAKAPDADPLAAALRLWASRVAAGTGSFAEEPPGIWELPGTAASRWEASLWRATCAMASGQFDRSLRLTDAAEQHVSHSGSAIETAGRTAQLLGQRLIIALQRLDWEEMGRLASANRPVYTARRPIMRTVNALMQIMIGDRAEATRHCDLLGDEFEEGIVPSRDLHSSVIGFANACLWLGHAKGIQIARRELTPWAGEHVLFYVAQYWGSVNFHLGRFAAFDGDLDEAIRYYRLGLDEHRAVGSTTFEARNHWYLAACLWHRDRGRDRAHAVEHHTVAATMAAEQGVPDLANRTWPPESPFHPG